LVIIEEKEESEEENSSVEAAPEEDACEESNSSREGSGSNVSTLSFDEPLEIFSGIFPVRVFNILVALRFNGSIYNLKI